jgi:hypothetical protein
VASDSKSLIARFCADVKNVHNIMNFELGYRDLWQDTSFQGYHLAPILGDLLSVRNHIGRDSMDVIFEAFRLAALLYVSNLRARFGLEMLSADAVYTTKLQALLAANMANCTMPITLVTWVLAVAYTSRCSSDEERSRFAETLKLAVTMCGTADVDGFMTLLSGIFWDENLLPTQSQQLKKFLAD